MYLLPTGETTVEIIADKTESRKEFRRNQYGHWQPPVLTEWVRDNRFPMSNILTFLSLIQLIKK